MTTNKMQEQSTMFMNMMWESWDNGLARMYDTQQKIGNASLEAMKKQQEMFSAIISNTENVENEMQKAIDQMKKLMEENIKSLGNEEAANMFGSWNEKMSDILKQMQQISITPSKSMMKMLEQANQRMYESTEKMVEEHAKVQSEAREVMEKFMNQLKSTQQEILDASSKTSI